MIRPIDRDDFRIAQAADPDYYHDSRFDYYETAIRMANTIAPAAKTALEMGPYRLPIFRGADTLDLRADLRPTYCQDAGKTPWPIAAGAYDLFVALQSFEHLGSIDDGDQLFGQYGEIQPVVFREVRRIARAAVISLPWHWNTPNDRRHHAIDQQALDAWFDQPPAMTKIDGRRIVLGFVFE